MRDRNVPSLLLVGTLAALLMSVSCSKESVNAKSTESPTAQTTESPTAQNTEKPAIQNTGEPAAQATGEPEPKTHKPLQDRTKVKKITTDKAMDDKLLKALGRLKGKQPTSGSGIGTGISGGSAKGVSSKQPSSPGRSQKVPIVKFGPASGDLGNLTKAEIDRVFRSRMGLFRACYQRELNRNPKLAGKVVMNFKITDAGKVKSVRTAKQNTLKNAKAESCIKRQLTRLTFPPKGPAEVSYPMVFKQG